MSKKVLIIIGIVVIAILGILFFVTGRERTDVYLSDYEISKDGQTMTLKIGITSSTGYIRTMKRTSGSMNYYFTFYSTFGINSKLGAKDTFEIKLDSNVDEIYFYTGDKGYKKVLEKDEITGEWIKVTEENNTTLPYIPDEIESNDNKTNDKEENYNRSPENVTIEVINDTITNSGLSIKITDNNKEQYGWGVEFRVQEKLNGEWKDLKYISNDLYWIEIAYELNKDKQLTQKLDIEKYYGKLSNGIYRIVKPVYDKKYIDIYSNEFEIK